MTDAIKSTDMAPKTPKSFRDLNKEQLVQAALFFGTEDEGNKEALLADLIANGVEWEQYVQAFLTEKPAEETVAAEEVAEEPTRVVAQEPTVLKAQDKYLIKMERKNPYFEFGKYKFTQENPYAIMPADDAQDILTKESGFRQALPGELQEYYS